MEGEERLRRRIARIDEEVQALDAERQECLEETKDASLPMALLYETGKPLETAIIDALNTFGFRADSFKDSESEFDIVFESAEGRFLGEAEGRDNAAISIDKFQQLERNIQEDFAKDGTDAYARGVLFGNPFRLTEPSKRQCGFTTKALSAAKRTGAALVLTPDMFAAVQYLKESKDQDFAKAVRAAIADTKGEIVRFPGVPLAVGQASEDEGSDSSD